MDSTTTDYVTVYVRGSIEPLNIVLDDLPSFNGTVHISWRNTSPLYKTSFNYDKCLELEFPSTELARKFILNFNKKLNITRDKLLNMVACAVIDYDEPTIETIKIQLKEYNNIYTI